MYGRGCSQTMGDSAKYLVCFWFCHLMVSWQLPDAHCQDVLDNFPAKIINESDNGPLMVSWPIADAHQCARSRGKGGTVADQRKVVKPRCHTFQWVSGCENPPPIGQPSHKSCLMVDRLGWVVTPRHWASLSISDTIFQQFVNQLSVSVSSPKIIVDRSPTLPPQV